MFRVLGNFVVRRRLWIVIGALIFAGGAGGWGAGVLGALGGGAGFDDPGSESVYADNLLAGPLGRYANDLVVLYESDTMTVDDPKFAEPVQRAIASVPRDDVVRLESFWSTRSESFVAKDRHATYVTVQLKSSVDQERVLMLRAIQDSFKADGLTVRFGGITSMTDQVNRQTMRDLLFAEALSIPILLILLVIIFRSLLAAALPLLIGIIAALGSLAVLRVVTFFADISTFAIQVVTILGLGLAIDYALLMVTRFREEVGRGQSVDEAVQRTVAVAGRTIMFSGIVVAISLAGLTLFPSRFLLSMGFAGAGVTLLAVLASLTVLPAMLRLGGHRLSRRASALPAPPELGRWYRLAHAVMRRPLVSTLGIVTLLVVLGLPFLNVNWARPADWVLPASADARVVTQQMAARFDADPGKLMTVVVESAPDRAALDDYAGRLDAVTGINSASVTGVQSGQARVTLNYSLDPMSREASRMVQELRAVAPPSGAKSSVTGMPASRVDIVNMVISRMPWMALFVAVVSFVVLFLAFGSILLPLKSVVLNLLSLSASFGAIKLIFQDGWLSGVLGFVPIGAVDVNFPVLIVAIAFGLAMDYEVFLLSRIREHWVLTGDPVESVAVGVQRTAKIITSAALLVVVVVGGFTISGIAFMQMAGIGLVIAVVVDATIVRMLLVPATMRLLGRWAWWSPRSLARLWSRYGVREGETAPRDRQLPAEV
jgi:RND superfamily putative drug exporter